MSRLLRCLIGGLLLTHSALSQAQTNECAGEPMQLSFDSGASWSFCARLDRQHGLSLSDLNYRAPGDSSRSVLSELHVSQILLQYHEDTNATALLGSNDNTREPVRLTEATCSGELIDLAGGDSSESGNLCTRERRSGVLAKFGQQNAIHGEQHDVFAAFSDGPRIYRVQYTLAEDGRITPSVSLSGTLSRVTDNASFGIATSDDNQFLSSAALLFLWRMQFSLDGAGEDDFVEEFDFPIEANGRDRRPLQIIPLSFESFRTVQRERFRSWRVRDARGAGYILDPQTSGHRFISREYNWPQFDLAVTRAASCEKHATANATVNCGASLDDFVNGEALLGHAPVLWFSLARNHVPRLGADQTVRSMEASFDLLPFDWTDASPFEVGQ